MNKKQVILTGRLAAPLCEGSRAWIRHHSGLVCTSRVVRIQSLTDRKAVFDHELHVSCVLGNVPFCDGAAGSDVRIV